MAAHQNANELWTYFRNVLNWVVDTFTVCRKEMKSVAWGPLYDRYGQDQVDTSALETEVDDLMADDEVKSKGIYTYVLTRDGKHLSLRQFDNAARRGAFPGSRAGTRAAGSARPRQR